MISMRLQHLNVTCDIIFFYEQTHSYDSQQQRKKFVKIILSLIVTIERFTITIQVRVSYKM